jgi:hypothetical protein
MMILKKPEGLKFLEIELIKVYSIWYLY